MDGPTSFSHISPVFLACETERFILMMEGGGKEEEKNQSGSESY